MRAAILIILIFLTLVCSFLCWKVLDGITHIPDETAYVFQGRIFASGQLRIDPPSVPKAFAVDHILMNSHGWYTVYPPGWPFLLSIGWLFHAYWLVNPILTAATGAGIFYLGTVLYGKQVAGIALLFFVVSPFTLLMGAGFMSHMASLCAGIWCVLLLVKAIQSDRNQFWIYAGLLAGFAFLVRPFTAMTLLMPAFLWSFWKKKSMLWAASGFLPVLGLFLLYNHLQHGNFLKMGYESDPFWRIMNFSQSYLWNNAIWYADALNRMLWGWPFPNLLVFLLLIRKDKHSRSDLLLAACSLSLIAGHCFFSYRDIVYAGPRYVFEMMGFAALLAARSMQRLQHLAGKKIFSIVTAILLILPPVYSLPKEIVNHSQIYHGQSGRFLKEIHKVGNNALIVLSGDPYVLRTFFFENALNPSQGGRIFCRDIPGSQDLLLKSFPRNEVWRYTIGLEALPGPNSYTDRWRVKQSSLQRLAAAPGVN